MQKTNKPFLRTGILLLLLLLTAGLFAAKMRTKQPQDAVILPDAAAREAWLTLRGWQLGTPSVSDTCIPAAWNTPAGLQWLALQHQQGLSPEQYAGLAAKRYLYPAENAGSAHCKAELLLCGDALAGAQIYDEETQVMRPVR
ncbi:MAG: DUF4830 domain-containing protein [Oscillospiraceae bacterium]|nr:DUF4830 domain-containing protein [Oscillospiraceae bacterium]